MNRLLGSVDPVNYLSEPSHVLAVEREHQTRQGGKLSVPGLLGKWTGVEAELAFVEDIAELFGQPVDQALADEVIQAEHG
jgi:hypothetical protein